MNLFDREKKRQAAQELPGGDLLMRVDAGVVEIVPVINYTAEQVETHFSVYARADANEYVRLEGGRIFAYGVDLAYVKETEEIKTLKQNVVLGAVFGDFQEPNRKSNIFMYVVIGVIFLMYLFKK